MNFKGNATGRDVIVYFSPAIADFEGVKPGVYKPGRDKRISRP